ncbi:LytTR family transcriptional regulator [Puteibacter caeruleilacunae]|nr:LytTR family transcriptional regulator [Puteibacter caeruleilacunae]
MNRKQPKGNVTTSIERVITLLQREYELLRNRKQLLFFVAILFVSTASLLAILTPFGLHSFPRLERYIIIFKYAGYPIILWYGLVNLLSLVVKKPYTILSTMILMLVLIVIGAATSYFIWADYFDYNSFSWRILMQFQVMAISVGFMPLLMILVLHSNYILMKRLREAGKMNAGITKSSNHLDELVEIYSQEHNKKYSFQFAEIDYIQSQDNYIKVVTNTDKSDVLIRTTLSSADKQINENTTGIFRCHNSYIVNMQKVAKVEGNASGYKLHLSAGIVPVSRKYVPIMKAYLEQISAEENES